MAIEVKVYNNLTRQKEVFKPLKEGEVKYYSCGPTTYDFLHVGNARALVVGDLINRIFQGLGYQTTFVRNFTDVDDKIIERSKELGVGALEHAAKYVEECKTDMGYLGMKDADHTPKVSETIPEIISMIETLVEKDFAYVIDGEVLYHTPAFKEYGKLSKKDLESLEHGRRVEVDSHKKHPSDFVLWKPAKPDEPSWDSPWGKGRPGWHIECSAMSKKFLGDSFDMHHGGVDLIFPHHENEIAQSEAANGCSFSTHWCHNEFLNFGSEKMSKSLGNVITIRAFCDTYGGEVLRQILLSVHYRSKMDWSEEVIKRAISDLVRIHEFMLNYEVALKENSHGQEDDPYFSDILDKIKSDLANDFNVPGAMAHFFGMIRYLNKEYLDAGKNFTQKKSLSPSIIGQVDQVLKFVKETIGCIHDDPGALLNKLNKSLGKMGGEESDSDEIDKLVAERKQARADKNWARSDEIRDILNEKGVVVKDNPDGTSTWRYQ